METKEKLLVSAETYPGTVHGEIALSDCHAGKQASDKDLAYTGLITRPRNDPEGTCGKCHEKQSDFHQVSLRSTLQ